MKVVFICESKVSLLNTYIISNSMYQKEDQKIVLMTNRFMDEEYIYYIDSLQYWDKVILVDAKESKKDINKFNKSFLEKEQPDVIHYFTIGHFTTSNLVNQSEEKCKIIFTEGSLAIYDPVYFSEGVRTRFNEADIIPNYDKVSEIWLLEKRLYEGKILAEKVLKEINLDLFRDNPKYHLQRLNVLFQYDQEVFGDKNIIIAPTYLTRNSRRFSFGWLAFLQECICKILENKKVIMKWHVTTRGNTTGIVVDDKSLNYLKDYVVDGEIPLELFVLNAIINKEMKKFITVSSSAAITTVVYGEKLCGETIEVIDLIRIYRKNLCYFKDKSNWVLDRFERANQILLKKIYLISEFKELSRLIADIDKEVVEECDDLMKDFRERDYEDSFVDFCIEEERLIDKNKKLQLYTNILDGLLGLFIQKSNVYKIICGDENTRLAIYGYGIIGKQLYNCLENERVVLIDNNVFCDNIITYANFLECNGCSCNYIVLTVYESQLKEQRIYNRLKEDFPNCKIISLEELNTILCAEGD